jgi:hypothetical protein
MKMIEFWDETQCDVGEGLQISKQTYFEDGGSSFLRNTVTCHQATLSHVVVARTQNSYICDIH